MRLTGDVAEDLAQETLFEAWRHIHNLHSQDRVPQWLSGIAHNVCLRWAHKRGRDLLQLAEPLHDPDASQTDLEDDLIDDFDLEIELERKELIDSHCEACGWSNWESLESLDLALPKVQRFYRQHQRVRFLPNYEVEADGRAAIVTSLESIT